MCTSRLRRDAEAIFRAGVAAISPDALVRRALKVRLNSCVCTHSSWHGTVRHLHSTLHFSHNSKRHGTARGARPITQHMYLTLHSSCIPRHTAHTTLLVYLTPHCTAHRTHVRYAAQRTYTKTRPTIWRRVRPWATVLMPAVFSGGMR